MGGDLTIIKLGGSVITDKAVPYKTEERNIHNIASDIGKYGKRNLLLIHGGGSVGHYLVEALGLNEPNRSASPLAVAKLSYEMDKLTSVIIGELLEEGVPAVSLATHSMLTTQGGTPKTVELSSVKEALSLGYVPVLRGDAILDSERGFFIFSGDDLAVLLASELNVTRVIMLMDMDGVIGSDGKVVRRLNLNEPYEDLIWPSDGKFDVTGGLSKKLESVKKLAQRGIKIYILSPRIEGRLLNALLGKPVLGTEVVM